MLGYALWLQGRAPEAERELRQASRALPQDAAIHINLGNALQSLGRLDEAVAEYKGTLQLDSGPSRAELLNDLGVTLAKLGRMGEAVSKFREALRINPVSQFGTSQSGEGFTRRELISDRLQPEGEIRFSLPGMSKGSALK